MVDRKDRDRAPGPVFEVPLLRPLLPAADLILPLLRGIDERRRYANDGPLLRRLEARLAGLLAAGEGGVVCVANGTAGLHLALSAQDAAPGGFCLMPAWTFPATAHAARLAGLEPCFVDVDPESWTLHPATARAALARNAGRVAAVVPVGLFGAPLDMAAWEAFRDDTGIPVVIDAAVGIDSTRAGRVPAVISLQATKPLGIGEGGLVVCLDRDLLARVAASRNFGLGQDREIAGPATNAKLDEYAAAVGNAALDIWPETRAGFLRVAGDYREAFRNIEGASLAPGSGAGHAASFCNIRTTGPSVDALAAGLAAAGIETRRWWGDGCHRHAAFADCPRDALPVTGALASSVLGLPCSRDLATADINRVAAAVRKIVDGS